MCHLVGNTFEGLSQSGRCYRQDWFKGWDLCWMAVGWCWLDLRQAAGHRIQSLERILLPFVTDNAGKVIVRQNHPLFKGIPPKNGKWQPHYNFLGHQFAKHCRCNTGESLFKPHYIRHLCSWRICIPNPSPHDEQDGPNLLYQKLNSKQAWNWILAAWNTIIWWLANRTPIQQHNCFIKTLMFKFVVDCIENRIQYWACIFWIKDLLIILQLLLNLPCTFVRVLFILNDLFQLLRYKLCR